MSNFHPLEVVGRYRDTQLQVSELNIKIVFIIIFSALMDSMLPQTRSIHKLCTLRQLCMDTKDGCDIQLEFVITPMVLQNLPPY